MPVSRMDFCWSTHLLSPIFYWMTRLLWVFIKKKKVRVSNALYEVVTYSADVALWSQNLVIL